jgi:hypothetical protein
MGKTFITDEVNDTYTADVYADGCLKAGEEYIYARIASGTASGDIATTSGKYLLHSVIFGNSGSGVLVIGNVTAGGASAVHSQLSASALCFRACGNPYSVLVDATFDRGLVYRLTSVDTDGIAVTYRPTA